MTYTRTGWGTGTGPSDVIWGQWAFGCHYAAWWVW